MMMIIVWLVELRKVHHAAELVEVKHGLVLTVLAKEGHVFAEIHVLEVVSNKAAIAALDALAEFVEDLLVVGHFNI